MLTRQAECSTCDDNGIYIGVFADGHEERMVCDCPAGDEHRARYYDKLLKHARFPEAYEEFSFRTFEAEIAAAGGDWKGKMLAYGAALMMSDGLCKPFTKKEAAQRVNVKNYTGNDAEARNSIVFTGECGVGKTGLAVSLARHLMAQGVTVLYTRVGDLFRELQATYARDYDGPSLDKLMYSLTRVPVLMLDEFEVNNVTNDRLDLMEQIIRGRQRGKHGRMMPLVATTNLSRDQFAAKWDKRIADVVFTAHWIGVGGVKLRKTVDAVESF